ncbi:MAG: hypothetical protein V3T02_09805 [Alphaproteobacteria bacterium]
MHRDYTVTPLVPDQIAQAYALIQAVESSVSLKQWRDFVDSVTCPAKKAAPNRGIMTLRNGEGYIFGLFTYFIRPDLHHGRVLVVDNFLAMTLLDQRGLAETLLSSMTRIGEEHGCHAINMDIAQKHTWITDYLTDTGHEVENLRFCKILSL